MTAAGPQGKICAWKMQLSEMVYVSKGPYRFAKTENKYQGAAAHVFMNISWSPITWDIDSQGRF